MTTPLAGSSRRSAFGTPPVHQIGEALLERDGRHEAEQSLAFACRRSRRGTGLTERSGANSGVRLRWPMTDSKASREFEQAGLGSAGDIEPTSVAGATAAEDIGARDVANMDEVHGLLAVAEDDRRHAGFKPLHPADQHLGVSAVDVHALAVDVEIAEGDVIEPVHVVVGAEQSLVEGLGRAVEGAVVVGVLPLGRRELSAMP